MVSGLDLLKPKEVVEQPKSGIDLLSQDVSVKSGMSLLSPSTSAPAEIAVEGIEELKSKGPQQMYQEHTQKMTKFIRDNNTTNFGIGVDGKPIEDQGFKDKVANVAGETLQGLSDLATSPIDTIKGGLDIALSVPGFLVGLVDAGSSASKEMIDQIVLGQTLNLEEVYNSAAKGMQRSMEFFEPGKEMVIGEPTETSQLASQVVMAPITGMSMLGHKVANWEGFADYPNIRGSARFAGDVAGLITMGAIVHGKSGRAKLAKDVEDVVKKSDEIIVKEQAVEGISNELIKQTQKKILELEKVQLELKAKEISNGLSKDVLIREELAHQAEVLAKEKLRPVEDTGLKEFDPEAIKKFNPLDEPKLESIDIKKEFGEVKKMTKEQKDKLIDEYVDKEYPIVEVDQATGTKLPGIEGELSPFFQGFKKTAEFKEIYAERAKAVTESPELFTQKLINDVNQWYHKMGEVSIDQVREGLSNLAARADELRGEFITGQDHMIWKESVSEAATWARRLEREGSKFTKEETMAKLKESYTKLAGTKTILRKKGKGVKLTSGVDPVEGTRAIAKGIMKSADIAWEGVEYARGIKKFNIKEATKYLREEFNRDWIDRSGNIRRDLLKKLGPKGYEVVQKMYLAKGASSVSTNMLKQMQKEVYRGLNKREKNILDGLIKFSRLIEIAEYKHGFKFPKDVSTDGIIPDHAIKALYTFKEKHKLTDKQAHDLYHVKEDGTIGGRVGAYYEWMKKPLKDMYKSGLITDAEFIALSSHNYRKLKLVDIFDKKRPKLKKAGRSIYDSGVESLKKGKDTDIFESSSEIMALEVFNRSYGRILNNEANKALLDVAASDPQNPFVRVRENKGDPIPSGWTRSFVYKNGERKAMYLSPEMTKEWITSNPETSYRLGQILRYSSGSPVLRTFATGINWGFALANLSRDVMHTWFAARTFNGKEWNSVYSPTAPVFGAQIGKDLISTFSDAVLKKGRYQDYINEGGGMEFLVHQGRLFQRGRHIEGPIDNVYNVLGYFGETSEIMTRLSIRDRVIRNQAKKQGLTMEQARKNKKITTEATFAARDYMDFGQGGGVAKALDNAVPYLNATIQGTRGMFRAFKPGSGTALGSTYKLAQFAALTTGLTVAAWKMSPLTMENLEGNVAAQNNMVIPLGDQFGFEDSRGQMRYPYLKIPLDPGQKFFKTFFEAGASKWLGRDIDVNEVVDSLKEMSPVGVSSLPPTISGTIGYFANKDFWLNEDIWRKTDKPFNYPQSKEEYIPGRTPQAFIDLGQATGLSPERTKYAVEELVTSGTVYSYLLGQGYDAMFSQMPKDQREKHLAEVLSKVPVSKRFFGITNPYSKHASKIEDAEEIATLNRFVENRKLDTLAEGYLFQDNTSRREVFSYINKDHDKKTRDRLKERFVFQEVTKSLPERSFWLRLQGVPVEARAEVFVERLDSASPEQQKQIWKEYGIVSRAKGIISKSFRREVSKLRGQVN